MEVDKKEVGSRIKKIRLSLGEKTEDFGKNFDPIANRSLVSAWENGRYLPSAERLKVIAELGNVTVEELLYESLDEYVVKTLVNSDEIKDGVNTLWLARNPLIITNRWNINNLPSEEEVIQAYKNYKNELLDTKEKDILLFGKEIYEMNIKRNKILEKLDEFEKLPLVEKHKELDEVSRHLQQILFWYKKHFGLSPKHAYEEYIEITEDNKKI